jgi:hypothetical protein
MRLARFIVAETSVLCPSHKRLPGAPGRAPQMPLPGSHSRSRRSLPTLCKKANKSSYSRQYDIQSSWYARKLSYDVEWDVEEESNYLDRNILLM